MAEYRSLPCERSGDVPDLDARGDQEQTNPLEAGRILAFESDAGCDASVRTLCGGREEDLESIEAQDRLVPSRGPGPPSLAVGAILSSLLMMTFIFTWGRTIIESTPFTGSDARSDSLKLWQRPADANFAPGRPPAPTAPPAPETHMVKDFLGDLRWQVGPKPDFVTGDVICNSKQPLTDRNWQPRGWDVSVGDRIQCESRNRVHAQWGTLRFDNWERNWCWLGVKEMCHQHLKTPKPWSEYRELAFRRGLAPSPEMSPFDGLLDPQVCDAPQHGIPKAYFPEEASLALKWFQQNVKVYVLNLPKFYNRWDIITKRLKELHIEGTRVIGVDMLEPNAFDDAKKQGWIDPKFDMKAAQAKAIQPQNDMGHILGTVGCAAAHFKVQSQILKDKPKVAMVLEDDSWLMDNFVVNLWRIVTQELPCDWDVLQLLGRCAFGKCVSEHLARIQPDANEPAELCHEGVNWGFHGVLYRTENLEEVQAKWKKRVFDPKTPHCLDIDVALASISDEVNYYSVPNSQYPPLIKEMDLGSVRASINLGFKVG